MSNNNNNNNTSNNMEGAASVPEYVQTIQSLTTEEREAGFGLHFTSMMQKNLILKVRTPVSTCLETFLPVLFILGLVGIWGAVDDGDVAAKQYVSNASTTTVEDFGPALDAIACSHSNFERIDGIRACTTAEESAGSLSCYNNSDIAPGFPRPGLCTTLPGLAVVQQFIDFRKPRYVPSLDEMILMQWIANASVPYSVEDGGYLTSISAIANGGYLYFAGSDGPAIDRLVDYMNRTSTLFRQAYFNRRFTTGSEAADFATSNEMADLGWGVVEVSEMSATTLDVTIHLNRSGVPWTNDVTQVGNGIGEFMTGNYLSSGFLTLQDVVGRYYMTEVLNVTAPPRTVHTPMPFAAYDTSSFLSIVGTLAGLFLVFGYLYPVSQLVKRIVEEKENRVREAMMIMGLTATPFYSSWVCTYFIFQVATALVAALLLKVTMLPKSDFFIMFLLYLLFGLSNITLSGVVSSFFSKSRIAALVAPVLFFIFAIPSFALPASTPAGLLVLLSLMSPTGFASGMKVLTDQEQAGGMTWGSINRSFNGYPMSAVLIMLALDTVLYLLLTLYFDAVLPSEWGTSKGWCFCFSALFGSKNNDAAQGEQEDGRDENGAFEPETPGRKPSVEIRGLKKEFILPDGSNFRAVDRLNFNMYEDQVFALLGHNGAGKTTAMNCMTGMLDMDAGDVRFHGHSVRHELADVRKEVGYCPQHNILWNELTCREHLMFFARLKGLPTEMRERAVEAMLIAVDLADKGDKFPNELSGGQKRKLSVGIAFIGGSRVVFLDEPTAGMDVGARRHTWELIKLMNKGRTIVLTTHFMDEADLLGHQVAIMAKGRLKCQGSSLFLKNRLGVGYTLSMSCHHHGPEKNDAIVATARNFVESAEVLTNMAGEVALRLPMDAVAQFPDLLSHLEDNGENLGIRGHGISVTTLEEVFLKIGHDDMSANEVAQTPATATVNPVSRTFDNAQPAEGGMYPPPAHDAGDNHSAAVPVDDEKKLIWNDDLAHTEASFGGQFVTLIMKRFNYSKRDTRTIVMQIVLPLVCITFAMLLALIEFPAAPRFEVGNYGDYDGDSDFVFSPNCAATWAANAPSGVTAVRASASAVTASPFSQYLLDEAKNHVENRIGAHMCSFPVQTVLPANPFNRTAPAVSVGAPSTASMFLTNTSIYSHSGPHALWEFQQTWMRTSSSNAGVTLKVATHPLPLGSFEAAFVDAFVTVFVAIFVLIPFTFIPSTFVSFVVKEREVNALTMQQASGLNYVCYWVSNFCFDITSFVVTALVALLIFGIFGRDEYIGDPETFFAMFVLLMLYGASAVAGSYACSFLFDSHSTAQNIVMLANFIAGFMLVLMAYILSIIDSTKDAGEALTFIFRIVPSFCLGDGILNLANRKLMSTFGSDSGAFDMEVTGWNMLFMGLEAPIFFALTLFIDSPLRRSKGLAEADQAESGDGIHRAQHDEDEDVQAERQEIESGKRDDDIIVVKGMRKYYPSNGGVLAVKNLSFGVHKGEVFGFLGTNGAGKSTTISILCGDQKPTKGKGFIAGHDIVQESGTTRRLIGYCPQFDALHDLLTVDEHLDLYAGLHGITGALATQVKERLIKVCELTEHRVKEARSLSGGNKRKLSVAISLLGAPQVVFLDEPSAGMDPMARRTMWGLIEQVAAHCSVVLTTHHLEEIEALASRTAIMVKGEMKCIGPLQHLKSKFGSGFEMSVRTRTEDAVHDLKQFVHRSVEGVEVQESQGAKITFSLPQSTKLSAVFSLIQQNKDNYNITDYSISQTSLESVFLRISADAEAEE